CSSNFIRATAKGRSPAKSVIARCKGGEQLRGLTFALSTNGRTRLFSNRYCGSRTVISPNFVCHWSFLYLGDASRPHGEPPVPSPRPAPKPNSASPLDPK